MMQPDPPFWQPALARPQLWRVFLGFALVVALYFAFALGLVRWAFSLSQDLASGAHPDAGPLSTVLMLATFLGVYPGLWFVARRLHGRSLGSLCGPLQRLCLRHICFGILAIVALSAVAWVVSLADALLFPNHEPVAVTMRPVGDWLIWLLPALGLVFFQSTAEELLFRGYLLSQLFARFGSFTIAGALPSVLFGLGHLDPSMGPNAWIYVLSTAILGLLAAAVTLRTGNLGAAVGLHFANNILAILVSSIRGDMDGLALFVYDIDPSGPYAGHSIFTSTLIMTAGFGLWWRWMNARDRAAA